MIFSSARVCARPIPAGLTESEFRQWQIAESERMFNEMLTLLREYFNVHVKQYEGGELEFEVEVEDARPMLLN